MATDSSDNYWGEMIFDEDGHVTFEAPHQWTGVEAARHIFLKELFCATTSVMRVLDEAQGPLEIHLACDNSAAAAAMRHMYSSNVSAGTRQAISEAARERQFFANELGPIRGQCFRRRFPQFQP